LFSNGKGAQYIIEIPAADPENLKCKELLKEW